MRQDWEPEDLIEVWTLLEDDMKRVWNKSGATRLGFALLLESFEVEARFPASAKEMPAAAVEYVAQQVKAPTGAWADDDWQGGRIKRHRKEIREAYGFRANTEEDQERLAEWPASELCPVELSRERLAEAVVARCRDDHIEPSAPGRVGRLVGKAVTDFEARFARSRTERISHATRSRLEDLVAGSRDEGADGEGAVPGGAVALRRAEGRPGERRPTTRRPFAWCVDCGRTPCWWISGCRASTGWPRPVPSPGTRSQPDEGGHAHHLRTR